MASAFILAKSPQVTLTFVLPILITVFLHIIQNSFHKQVRENELSDVLKLYKIYNFFVFAYIKALQYSL